MSVRLNIIRKALLRYTGNDVPGVDYPPHSVECSWSHPTRPGPCTCGVQEIIDHWEPPKVEQDDHEGLKNRLTALLNNVEGSELEAEELTKLIMLTVKQENP